MSTTDQDRLRPVFKDIHAYWFGDLPSPSFLPEDRKGMWFTRSDATDAHIREHYGAAISEAAAIDWNLQSLTREEQIALVVPPRPVSAEPVPRYGAGIRS